MPWVENRPTAGSRALRIGELWAYRELIAFLALRDMKVRYKQALFGAAWAVAQPLAGAIAFTLIFRRIADLPSDGVPYLIFAFTGFCLWSYFTTAVNAARNSLVTNASLITKVYFPRLTAPLAAVLPPLVDLVPALVVLVGFMFWYGVSPGLPLLLSPLFIAAGVLVAIGTGTLFATLSVQYRDVQQVFGLVIQLWLFASPVAYPTSLIPGRLRWIYFLNPMVGVLDGFRWTVLGRPHPDGRIAWSAVSTLIILLLGLRIFQRAERRFADVI